MEINRYEEYKKELNQILELNTYITFKDFLNVANEIYENNFLNFDFPIIMVKNKYYNWVINLTNRTNLTIQTIRTNQTIPTTMVDKHIRICLNVHVFRKHGGIHHEEDI